MKPEGRRDIVCRLGRGNRGQESSEHDRASCEAAVWLHHFHSPAVAKRRCLKSPFCHCWDAAKADSVATLRVQVDRVNCFAFTPSCAHSAIPNRIFRQEFFDSRAKIKFRFLLVASQNGFYSQARWPGARIAGVNKMWINFEEYKELE